MDKRLRIQYFDHEGRILDDRLVTQDPEFYKGPKFAHKGPVRIEFTLDNKEDIEKCKVYLDQLIGNLPLAIKKQKAQAKMDFTDNREEFLSDVLSGENLTDQDVFIKYLRDHGFVFIMWDYLDTFKFPIDIKEKHQGKYQWMIRMTRRAKNPNADKYDPMLLFGIQLLDERSPTVVIYLNGEYNKLVKIPIPDKPRETFKKSGMMKFPHYMTEEERDKFRKELRQYQDSTERPLSKFYLRWSPYVDNIPNIPERTNPE